MSDEEKERNFVSKYFQRKGFTSADILAFVRLLFQDRDRGIDLLKELIEHPRSKMTRRKIDDYLEETE